jgi:hypothetical protein
MPRHDPAQARFQRRHIQRPTQPQRRWNEVCPIVRIKLIEKPQPLLGK